MWQVKKLTEEEISAILNKEIETFFPWLSKLFEQKLANKGIEIPAQKIQQFMEKSEIFDELRHNYELKIVHWQITYMKDGGSGWLMPKGYDDFSLLVRSDVDKIFRGWSC